MAKKKRKLDICLDWKTILLAVVVIIIGWGVYKMAIYQQTAQLPPHECASSADCSTGYVCFIHRFCGTPNQPTQCGPFLGDLKCHKACDFNSDCPSGQACETRMMWVGDTGTGIPMCFDISNTCQGYCQNQSNTTCDGQWNISGEYPDCNCQRLCDETCQAYCQKQPHILCLGDWNISGEYPDCNCQYLCDEGGPV